MNTASNLIVDDFRPEDEARKNVASWYTPGLSDGLGDRLLMFDNRSGSGLELLRFRREFATRPQFEEALRRRVAELDQFSHPDVAKVRAVDSLGMGDGLALVSNQTIGRRLSELLSEAHGSKFALELLRQLMPVLAALQNEGEGVSHGIITADRIVVTPDGRLILVEHVIGSAVESLNLPADRLRLELGIPVPVDAGRRRSSGVGVPLDQRADVLQLGFVALSLLAGRLVDPADYPHKSLVLLDKLAGASDGLSPSPQLLSWLERALQLGDQAFESAQEAHDALDDVADESDCLLIDPRSGFEVFSPAAALEAPVSTDPVRDFLSESEEVQGASDETEADAAPPAPKIEQFRPVPNLRPLDDPADWARVDPSLLSESSVRPGPPAGRSWASGLSARWVVIGLSVAVVAEAIVIAGMVRSRQAGLPAAAVGARSPQTAAPPPTVNPAGASAKTDGAADGQPSAAPLASYTTTLGRLEVSSDPQGARVTVDGTRRGVTPLIIQVTPGPHTVVVSDGKTTSTRSVNVAAGASATLLAALPPSAGAGWASINAPIDLQVREGGSLIGVTSADRLMLPAGRHDLTLSAAALGFQTTLSIEVQPGKTTSANVSVPSGSLSINALPWANIWLDGRSLGTTPLANLDVPLGSHEVIWRHPQLGERRQTVVVTAKSPVRVVMDLSK